MIVKVKKLHSDAQLPQRGSDIAAGFDVIAVEDPKIVVDDNTGVVTYVEYRTGIAIEPPEGYHTELFPRSSVSKYDLVLANSIGLGDQDYRGEIIFRYKPVRYKEGGCTTRHLEYCNLYKKGDRIGQIVLRKTEIADMIWAEELSDTNRGSGGFGSTG